MASSYISTFGNDTNNGSSPDASQGVNGPWRNLAKGLGAAGITSGDILYVAPGTYREQVVVNMTSATAETKVLGDPLNTRGFRNGSGVLLEPGIVKWTGYDVSDVVIPTGANPCLNLNARDFLTFENFYFVGGKNTSAQSIQATTVTSQNITLRSCAFVLGAINSPSITITIAADTSGRWVIERCIFVGGRASTGQINIAGGESVVTEYDIDMVVRNCVIVQPVSRGIQINTTGTSTFLPRGFVVQNCTIYGNTPIQVFNGTDTTVMTTPAVLVENCMLEGSIGIQAGHTSQVLQRNNVIHAATPRQNVSADASTKEDGSYPPDFMIDAGLLWGLPNRAFFAPIPGSKLLGWGAGGSILPTDLFNRPRPSGGESLLTAAGAVELHDYGVRDASMVDTGEASILLTGPGDHEFVVLVDPVATTISVKVRYDSNHGATNKAQVILRADASKGIVSAQTLTMTASADTWETLTFGAITPTIKTAVRIAVLNRAAAGTGKCWAESPRPFYAMTASPIVAVPTKRPTVATVS